MYDGEIENEDSEVAILGQWNLQSLLVLMLLILPSALRADGPALQSWGRGKQLGSQL
jgi:hypothetical protein